MKKLLFLCIFMTACANKTIKKEQNIVISMNSITINQISCLIEGKHFFQTINAQFKEFDLNFYLVKGFDDKVLKLDQKDCLLEMENKDYLVSEKDEKKTIQCKIGKEDIVLKEAYIIDDSKNHVEVLTKKNRYFLPRSYCKYYNYEKVFKNY